MFVRETQGSSSMNTSRGSRREEGPLGAGRLTVHMCQGSGWVADPRCFLFVCRTQVEPALEIRQWAADSTDQVHPGHTVGVGHAGPTSPEVLVDLGHILHHTLPVRPVRV